VVWKTWDKQASYATPVIGSFGGRSVALCLMRQGLVGVLPGTGEVLFSRWFRAPVEESVNAANPVVVGDLVLITAAYYGVGSVLLRIAEGGSGFHQVWASQVLEVHWSTPVYRDGHVFAFSGRNEPDASFRCVELVTGKLKWERDESWVPRSSPQPPVYGRGSAIFADGKLIVLGEGGRLGLVRASSEALSELAVWQVPMLEYPSWTAPVLADGKLYLRDENSLVCLEFEEDAEKR
jgi:hypothetical protein